MPPKASIKIADNQKNTTATIILMTTLLINATKIHQQGAALYEFILQLPSFSVQECYYIRNQGNMHTTHIPTPTEDFQDHLFEINHLRSDPLTSPAVVIHLFHQHLLNCGLDVPKPEKEHEWLRWDQVKMRFSFDQQGKLYFLSPSHRHLHLKAG